MPTDEGHLRTASYGPGGMIQRGSAFDHLEGWQIVKLAESMQALGNALEWLSSEDREAWLTLQLPYTSDVADYRVVEKWRQKRSTVVRGRVFKLRFDRAIANHDLAIELLARRLRHVELFVEYPKRSTSTTEDAYMSRNDAAYATFRSLRDEDKLSKTKAVSETAVMHQYTERRIWQIVQLREELER